MQLPLAFSVKINENPFTEANLADTPPNRTTMSLGEQIVIDPMLLVESSGANSTQAMLNNETESIEIMNNLSTPQNQHLESHFHPQMQESLQSDIVVLACSCGCRNNMNHDAGCSVKNNELVHMYFVQKLPPSEPMFLPINNAYLRHVPQHVCSFFSAHLDGILSKAEGFDLNVTSEFTDGAIYLFHDWLMTGTLPREFNTAVLSSTIIHQTWVLASKLHAPEFANAVMELLCDRMAYSQEYPAAHVAYVYARTNPHDKLRIFMQDVVKYAGPFHNLNSVSISEYEAWNQLLHACKEFARDVCFTGIHRNSPRDWPWLPHRRASYFMQVETRSALVWQVGDYVKLFEDAMAYDSSPAKIRTSANTQASEAKLTPGGKRASVLRVEDSGDYTRPRSSSPPPTDRVGTSRARVRQRPSRDAIAEQEARRKESIKKKKIGTYWDKDTTAQAFFTQDFPRSMLDNFAALARIGTFAEAVEKINWAVLERLAGGGINKDRKPGSRDIGKASKPEFRSRGVIPIDLLIQYDLSINEFGFVEPAKVEDRCELKLSRDGAPGQEEDEAKESSTWDTSLEEL